MLADDITLSITAASEGASSLPALAACTELRGSEAMHATLLKLKSESCRLISFSIWYTMPASLCV
eukprot:15317379-Alexandrium_andersonii.AAC.1